VPLTLATSELHEMQRPSFGDHVRIAVSAETTAVGISAREGVVSGFTTPSITNVEVVGHTTDDYAVAVMIDSLNNETFWLAEHLVEFLDHAAGTEIWVSGSTFKEIRNGDGSWRKMAITSRRQPWWKFW